ncbi:MAG TPA: tetratricopeptide repeat protein [Vicinamibacterales bacterium]|nr:tetratricopeptide repeat protein [Vicinamibacterales bacterium]
MVSTAPETAPSRALGPALWICLGLIAANLIVFGPVVRHGFINLDDPQYVTENRHVLGGLTWQSLAWAATASYAGNWHPLTWVSHMLDVRFFGVDPRGHHLSSLVLHILNTLLVFGVLHRMTRAPARSAAVAALFAIHPLHVESVAWVAERKDVLSAFFWLLTMWAYVRYVERSNLARYTIVLLCFVAGLAAKPMVVTLPFVLLLLDYWPLRRVPVVDEAPWTSPQNRTALRGLVLEKLPMFGCALASGAVTVWVQKAGGAMRGLDALPVGDRVANALQTYLAYIGKMLWPANLAALYPISRGDSVWPAALAALVLVSITLVALRAARRCPFVPVGWLWYLGTLVPVIGLVQVGSQRMADRFTYIPFVGLFVIVAWGVPLVLRRSKTVDAAVGVVAAVLLAAGAAVAREQTAVWHDSIRLWRHTLAVTENNHLAHHYLAHALAAAGQPVEAAAEYRRALEIRPDYPDAHNGLGVILAASGKHDEAIAHYRQAIRFSPQYAAALTNLGASLMAQSRTDEALIHLREAVRLDPEFAQAHSNLGTALANTGRPEEAIPSFETALRLGPGYADAHRHLGATLAMLGRTTDAIAHYSEALRINPDDALAQNGMGAALAAAGRLDEALARYREAVRLNPGFADAHANLGNTLARAGRTNEAIEHLLESLRLNPADADARYDVAVLLWRKGQAADALHHLEILLKQHPAHEEGRRMLAGLGGDRNGPTRAPEGVR